MYDDNFPPISTGRKSMGTILLVVYITAAISMIVLILLQRSEGGALGMGGGGGGLVTGRGAANFLTRTTAILAAIFFLAAIGLGMLGHRAQPSSAVVGSPGESTRRGEHTSLRGRACRESAEQPTRAQAAQAQAGNGSVPIVQPCNSRAGPGRPSAATASTVAISAHAERSAARLRPMSPLKTESLPFRWVEQSITFRVHGAIHLYYRRRGFLVR